MNLKTHATCAVTRVVCEFAGSGEHCTTLDFNFAADIAISDKRAKLKRYVTFNTPVCYPSVRLFHDHNGPELTVNPGCFGTQRVSATQAADSALLLLQSQQAEQTCGDARVHEIVIAVAKYDDVDTANTSMYNLDDVEVYLSSKATEAYVARPYILAKGETLYLHRDQMLASANFMRSVSKGKAKLSEDLICEALRDDLDFMAECKQSSHLASPRLLSCKDFAVLAFTNSRKRVRDRRMLSKVYRCLAWHVQADREVVLLAAQSEGCQILECMPRHLADDIELFMLLVLHDYSAIKYASDKLRCDPDLIMLCEIQEHLRRRVWDSESRQNQHATVVKNNVCRYVNAIRSSSLCSVACLDRQLRELETFASTLITPASTLQPKRTRFLHGLSTMAAMLPWHLFLQVGRLLQETVVANWTKLRVAVHNWARLQPHLELAKRVQ